MGWLDGGAGTDTLNATINSGTPAPVLKNIENVNRLYNEPTMLLVDDDAIYMLPIEDAGGDNNEGDDDVR